MIKNLMQLYSLSICFISALIVLICLIFLAQSTVDLMFFEVRHKDRLEQYSNNENYLLRDGYSNVNEIALTAEQLTERRLIMKNNYIQTTRTSSINTVINTFIGIVISLLFLVIHFKIYKKALTS